MNKEPHIVRFGAKQKEPTKEQVIKAFPNLLDPQHYISQAEALIENFNRNVQFALSEVQHLDNEAEQKILDFFQGMGKNILETLSKQIELEYAGAQEGKASKATGSMDFVVSAMVKDWEGLIGSLRNHFDQIEGLIRGVYLIKDINSRWEKAEVAKERVQERIKSAKSRGRGASKIKVKDSSIDSLPKNQQFEIKAKVKKVKKCWDNLENLESRLDEKAKKGLALESEFRKILSQIEAEISSSTSQSENTKAVDLSSFSKVDLAEVPSVVLSFRGELQKILSAPHQEALVALGDKMEKKTKGRINFVRECLLWIILAIGARALATPHAHETSSFVTVANGGGGAGEPAESPQCISDIAPQLIEKLFADGSSLSSRKIELLAHPVFNGLITNQERLEVFKADCVGCLMRVAYRLFEIIPNSPEFKRLDDKERNEYTSFIQDEKEKFTSEIKIILTNSGYCDGLASQAKFDK